MTSSAQVIPISEARNARAKRVSESGEKPRAHVQKEARATTHETPSRRKSVSASARVSDEQATKQDRRKAEKLAKADKAAVRKAEKLAKADEATARKNSKAAKANERKAEKTTNASANRKSQVTTRPAPRNSVSFDQRVSVQDTVRADAKDSERASKKAASSARKDASTKPSLRVTVRSTTNKDARDDASEPSEKKTKAYAQKVQGFRVTLNRMLSNKAVSMVLTFTLVAAAAVGILYSPAQTYYQSIREQASLAEEYNAIVESNNSTASYILYMKTEDGVIQAARETLGWVEYGDNAVVVYGIERSSETEEAASEAAEESEAWYLSFLDWFFGVE